MDVVRMKNRELLEKQFELLEDLNRNLNELKADISHLKRELFLIKTIKEVKSETQKVEEPPKKESESWFWPY